MDSDRVDGYSRIEMRDRFRHFMPSREVCPDTWRLVRRTMRVGRLQGWFR